MIVRAAARGDGEQLAAIHASAFDAPWSAVDILRFADERGGFALAAEAEAGELAGFILCRAIAGEAEILTLAVRPAQRRRGVAGSLVDAALATVAPVAEAMFLEVAADNPGALALYERLGFERAGRRAGYYARPAGGAVDAIVMRRALNS